MGCCCTCVDESTVGAIESCGRFSHFAYPGCNCLIPCVQINSAKRSLKQHQLDVHVQTRTKDNVFVTISVAAQYKIATDPQEYVTKSDRKRAIKRKDYEALELDTVTTDSDDLEKRESSDIRSGITKEKLLYNAFYSIEEPEKQMRSYIEEHFRVNAVKYTMDELFLAKEEITNTIRRLLNKKMNQYGFVIKKIIICDIDPEAKVKAAMNDIVASEKEKVAQQKRAEAEKITKILTAEADAKTRELAGQGVAAARKAIIQGLKESVEDFTSAVPGATSTSVMSTVLMTQYMDTIKEVGLHSARNTFILPSSPAHVSTVEEQMRAAILSTGGVS